MKSPSTVIAKDKDPASNPWVWHLQTLRALHRRLARDHDEHLQASSAPADKDTHDFADTASGELERERLFATLLAEGNRLSEVEAALERIAAGTYGVCEATGKVIPDERLRALPWTRYTREAAEARERDGRRGA